MNFFTIIGREDLIEDERFSSIKARSKDINTLYNLVRKSVAKKRRVFCCFLSIRFTTISLCLV